MESQGQAVSINPNKSEPTWEGKIIRGLIKAPLEAALSIPEMFTAGKPVTVHSGYLGDTSGLGGTVTKKSQELAGRLNRGEITPTGAVLRSLGSSASETANVASGVLGTAGAVGLAKGLLTQTAGALATDEAQSVLKQYAKDTASNLKDLSWKEQVNALTEAAKTADAATAPILQKASQQALAQVMKEAGIGSFAELNPKTAKALGIGWRAIKYILAGAGILEGGNIAKKILGK